MITEHHGHQDIIKSPEGMYETIRKLGIVPFFVNAIPDFSVEELTPEELWFNDDELGPWDWKIHVVESGDIAYGKFLCGGKSAFATAEWYRELMNYRRALPKYSPEGLQTTALDAIMEAGGLTTKELRKICGLNKSRMDGIMTKLQMGTRVIIGAFERQYRGEDLHYSGWQLASFCTPDDFFEDFDMSVGHSPKESGERIFEHLRELAPQAGEKQLWKTIG